MRPLLARRIAPLFVLAAVVLAGCGDVADDPAATAGDREVSVESLEEELELIRDNKAYREALEQSYGVQLAGAGKGTFDAQFTAQVLSLRIYYSLLEDRLAKDGISVSSADEREATELVEEQLESLGGDVKKDFPASYRQRLARQEALVAKAQEAALADVEAACASHILISSETRTPEEARAIAEFLHAQLQAGADFAAVAAASSEDPGSKDQGGELGCNPPGAYVEAFDEAVFEQEVGEVGEPVETEFGYHIILVEERGSVSAEELGQQAAGQALNAYLLDATCGEDVEVDVNPRYGRWDRTGCEDQTGLAAVLPPVKPSAGS